LSQTNENETKRHRFNPICTTTATGFNLNRFQPQHVSTLSGEVIIPTWNPTQKLEFKSLPVTRSHRTQKFDSEIHRNAVGSKNGEQLWNFKNIGFELEKHYGLNFFFARVVVVGESS
jgi:hypothetical protein